MQWQLLHGKGYKVTAPFTAGRSANFIMSTSLAIIPFGIGASYQPPTTSDPFGHFNTSTGKWTAPFTGSVSFTNSLTVQVNSGSINVTSTLVENGVGVQNILSSRTFSFPAETHSATITFTVTAGKTYQIEVVQNTGSSTILGPDAGTFWSGVYL